MTRKDWQRMALAHCDGARTLLREGSYSAAYHLAGLAIECALKARIARAFRASTWPNKDFVQQIHNHKLQKLVKQADLDADRVKEEAQSPLFRAHWNAVKDWEVDSRYKQWSPAEACDMVEAVSKRSSGVLAWIKRHW